ncbi:MAG: MMPL family transporter [Saprospiraceae bacterium]|jgi:predicted RND superfamily exporter protein
MATKYKFEISLIASMVLLGLSIYTYNNLNFDFNLRKLFPSTSSDTKFYDEFVETFDAHVDENAMIIVIPANAGIFNQHFLYKLDSLSSFLSSQEFISKVYSITNLNCIYFTNNEFNARSLVRIDKPELYEQDSLYIFSSPEYYKHFFSKNHKACALTVLFKTPLISTQFNVFNNKLMLELNKLNLSQVHILSAKLIEQAYVQQIKKEAIRFSIISFLFITIGWVLIFKSIKQLFIPILALSISLVIVLSIMAYSNQTINLLSSLLPIILITTCLTGIIHLISINTELETPRNHNNRFYNSLSTGEKAVLISSITSAIGFLALIFSDIQALQTFGLFTALGIMIVFVTSLLFLKRFLPGFQNVRTELSHRTWYPFYTRFYNFLVKHSVKIIVSSFFILIVSIFFITKIKINGSHLNEFPTKHPITSALLFFEKEFGGSYPIEIVLTNTKKNESFYELSQLQKVDTFIQFLEDSCNLQLIRSPVSLIKATNKAYNGGNPTEYEFPKEQSQLNGYLQNIMQTEYAEDLRRYLTEDGQQLRISGTRADLQLIEKQTFDKKITGFSNQMSFKVQQTGAAYTMELIPYSLIETMLPSLVIALFILSILMWTYFNMAWLIPIALFIILFPMILLAGFMGLTGIYLKADTAILFSFAFVLSVDYTIHFLNRFKTENSKSKHLDDALRATGVLIAKPLTIKSLILLSGFLSLLISDFKGIYTMGIMISMSIVFVWICHLTLLPFIIRKYFNKFIDNQYH